MFEQIKKLNFLITKRQRRLLVILNVLLFIGIFFEVFGSGVLIPAISVVLDPDFFYKTPEIESIIQFFGTLSQTRFTFLFLGLVVLIYLLKSFFLIVLTYRQNKFLANLNAFLTNALFEKYMKPLYSFHLK
jgi:ABC-type multidrug transport system fused ATPase/permease subunit